MKKFYLFSIFIFGFASAYSQTQINLTFTAKNGISQNPVPLDSVYVTNMDMGCDTILYGASPMLTIQANLPVGMEELGSKPETFRMDQNYPNPFRGSTQVNINREYSGTLHLALFDGLGLKLAEYSGKLDMGLYSFRVSCSGNKVLFLVVSDDKNYRSIKIISTGNSSEKNAIQFLGQTADIKKNVLKSMESTGFILYLGNQLIYTGYANGYHESTILDHPVSDSVYLFSMVPLTIAVVPTLTTASTAYISQTTATSGGTVTSDGGASVTARGVCWSTTPTPTISGSHTSDGIGLGTFVSSITGLDPNTQFFVRAYATNSVGTAYGNELSFYTLPNPEIPTLNTTELTNISATTATGGGNITSSLGAAVTAKGVCWNTSPGATISNNFTNDGGGNGSFVSNLTGLSPNTLYYVRAYATNIAGTGYGNEVIFTTLPNPIIPTVSTSNISNILQTTAAGGGNVTFYGYANVSARGVCWSTTPSPTLANSFTNDGFGTGTFFSNLTGLSIVTQYYVRAYATNSAGTGYGNEVTFTTLQNPILPTVTTDTITNIWPTSATGGGNVTFWGYSAVTTRGVCWSTSPNPTIANNYTADSSGTGTFISELTGLNTGTIYFVRAYATNMAGTAYGNQVTFTPQNLTVTTSTVTNITSISAIGGGNVTCSGGPLFVSRGICWSTAPYPTVNNNSASVGSGLGSYTGPISWLLPNTVYHIRAWASNNVDLVYGNELTFTTLPATLPSVTTALVQYWFQSTATCGGGILSDSGSAVTARGVCWSTSQNPTLANNHTTDGSGIGGFVSTLTGLAPNTQYYVRAYATNGAGTAYGSQKTFNNTYYIGKNYGGGIIFYVDTSFQHGLIAAPTDQSTSIGWGCAYTSIGGTTTAFGAGQANTTAIVNSCGGSGAAKICDTLVLNGYSDWYLPSYGELEHLSDFQGYIGGFVTSTPYWSSSQYSQYEAYMIDFSTNIGYYAAKTYSFRVRAARSF